MTDAALMPYCDISGECLLIQRPVPWRNQRPVVNALLSRTLGWKEKKKHNGSVARAVFFINNPSVDRQYSISDRCGDPRCVRASHIIKGVFNPKKEAEEPKAVELPLQT
jgi:hypothetical protein